MKKYLLIIAAAVFALAACDKKPEVAPEMSLDKTEASFEAAGGAVSVVVTSNTNWTVKGATDWLSVSPDSGNGNGNVMLNATANESKSARNATVTFVCSAKNINVKVTQAGKVDSTPDPEPEPEPEKKITAITSADDFAKFAAETYEAGEVVTLEADITVKEMVPELVCTLDGKGHTITLDITTDEAITEGNAVPQNVGLFRVLSGTVKNPTAPRPAPAPTTSAASSARPMRLPSSTDARTASTCSPPPSAPTIWAASSASPPQAST